ncbi:MAG: tRNA pseudouridine(55) synthase TruB [Deltaproteobacteria bacterium]|nr:tRNA pseudouridine(55) synthase TruB [Deltaproteobacteria bacterium]
MITGKTDQEFCGVLVVDKPAGMTSFDVIRRIRRATRVRRIGHTGTLDPMATGVLVLCLGLATRLVPFLQTGFKDYSGRLLLGMTTDTDDFTGRITGKRPTHELTVEEILAVIQEFQGTIDQMPPAYSAVKINGQPAYRLARRGEKVQTRLRTVIIHHLEVTKVDIPFVDIRTIVSPGTYIRSLAADIGRQLGTGACLAGLRRLATGPFDLSQALPLEEAMEMADAGQLSTRIIPIDQAVSYLPGVKVDATMTGMVTNGRPIFIPGLDQLVNQAGLVRIQTDSGRLLAVYEYNPNSGTPDGNLKPVRVLGIN